MPETFDFDGGTAAFFLFDLGTASSTTLITDATPSPVTFALSVDAIVDRFDLAFLKLTDTTAPGFMIEASSGPTNAFNTVNTLQFMFELTRTTAARKGFTTTNDALLVVNSVPVIGTPIDGGAAVLFTISNPTNKFFTISSLTVGFSCFCAGTRITTPSGITCVEDLSPGDLVRLVDGRETAVRWLGRQRVDTALATPGEANPIRITRGALGHGLPERDLRVSPDHAIAIDGYLINAGALVNGTTIYQERAIREGFTYYHIETDAHELILAEGVAAETFVDYTTRDRFENAHEAPGRVIDEMHLPRVSSARLVPEYIKRRIEPLIAAE